MEPLIWQHYASTFLNESWSCVIPHCILLKFYFGSYTKDVSILFCSYYFWYCTTFLSCVIWEFGAREMGWEVSVQIWTIYFHCFIDQWEHFLFHYSPLSLPLLQRFLNCRISTPQEQRTVGSLWKWLLVYFSLKIQEHHLSH